MNFFNSIKNEHEEILWSDRPVFKPWILPDLLMGIPILGFVIYWTIKFSQIGNSVFSLFGIILILIIIAAGIIKIFSFDNTAFGYTQYRVLIRSGFWGTDFVTIDYDKIMNMEININPIESMYNTGSIRFYSGKTRSTKHGSETAYDAFKAIKNPYEVLKKIKQISLDVKTDINYPNALRPNNNPGYNTDYKN